MARRQFGTIRKWQGSVRGVPDDVWIDPNGAPTERYRRAEHDVVVHYDDVPEKDRAIVRGVPCTTALRTVIDVANDLTADELRRAVDDCLARGLFTAEEAMARTDEDDMRGRPGARLLRDLLSGPPDG